MNASRIAAAVAVFALAAPAIAGDPDYAVKVTPTEFFSGELKRLKPHVDFDAWCFKINLRRSVQCDAEVEMWCDGKRVDKPKYGYHRDKQSDELTLSMRQKFADGKTEYLVNVGGQKSFGRRIEEPKPSQKVEAEFGPLTINKPVEIKSVGGSVIVWAMGAGNGASLDKQDEVERMLKTAPWLLILRLRAESEE